MDPAEVKELSAKIAQVSKDQAVAEESRKGIVSQVEESRREAREANLRLELAIKSFVDDIRKSVGALSDEIKSVSKTDAGRELKYSWTITWLLFTIAGSLLVSTFSLLWFIFEGKH